MADFVKKPGFAERTPTIEKTFVEDADAVGDTVRLKLRTDLI